MPINDITVSRSRKTSPVRESGNNQDKSKISKPNSVTELSVFGLDLIEQGMSKPQEAGYNRDKLEHLSANDLDLGKNGIKFDKSDLESSADSLDLALDEFEKSQEKSDSFQRHLVVKKKVLSAWDKIVENSLLFKIAVAEAKIYNKLRLSIPHWIRPDVDTVDIEKENESAKEAFRKDEIFVGYISKKIHPYKSIDDALKIDEKKGIEAEDGLFDSLQHLGVTINNDSYNFEKIGSIRIRPEDYEDLKRISKEWVRRDSSEALKAMSALRQRDHTVEIVFEDALDENMMEQEIKNLQPGPQKIVVPRHSRITDHKGNLKLDEVIIFAHEVTHSLNSMVLRNFYLMSSLEGEDEDIASLHNLDEARIIPSSERRLALRSGISDPRLDHEVEGLIQQL
jgi:hypothetical protein